MDFCPVSGPGNVRSALELIQQSFLPVLICDPALHGCDAQLHAEIGTTLTLFRPRDDFFPYASARRLEPACTSI